jgi:hypothetical protein
MRALRITLLATIAALFLAAPATARDSDPDDRVVIAGGTVVPPGVIVGDVVVVEGDVAIGGRATGDVVAFEGDVLVRGIVEGDLTTFAGQAVIGPRARVLGDIVYSDEQPRIAPRAVVGGEVREEDWDDIGDAPWAIIGAAALWIAVTISLLVAGVALVAVFPRALEAAERAFRSQAWLAVAMGIAALIGIPLVIGLAFVTLVGIPLAIMLGLAFLPLAAIGYLVCCFVLGRAVTSEGTNHILAFLAGLGILRAIALIPVLGALAWIPAVVIGLGALIVAAMPEGRAEQPSASA